MASGSVSWVICLFVAVVTASDYRETFVITGSDPGVTDNRLRTDSSEWSVIESVQKFADVAGSSTRLVVGRAAVASRSPAVSAMLERQAMGAGSGEGAVQDVRDPILRQLADLFRTIQARQVANMAAPLLPEARKDGEPDLEAECDQQPAEQLSAETAVATAVRAIKHSCDDVRQVAVDFIKDHLGQVLATQGWAHAVRTQSEEVVQLSRLMAEQMAATRMPSTAETTTTTATTTTAITTQPDDDVWSQSQTPDTASTPVASCPTTPLDEVKVAILGTLLEEEKGKFLIETAQQGDVEDLRSFLAAGAPLAAVDGYGRAALHWAARNGHAEAASCLLAAGADVGARDYEAYRPLHMAAMGGDPDVVRLLAAWGADPNARDKWDWTPLHLTVREHRPEAALALLEAGADAELRSEEGLTPLEMARSRRYRDQEMEDVLAENQ